MQLTRTVKCSRYQRLPLIDAGIIPPPPKKKKTLSSSQCQLTQDENTTLQLRDRDVAVTCAQLQLDGHNNECSLNSILNWDRSLPQSWRPSRLQVAVHLGVQPTATCSRHRRHETLIRASDKLQNKRSHAVRVSWALHGLWT